MLVADYSTWSTLLFWDYFYEDKLLHMTHVFNKKFLWYHNANIMY